MNIEELRIVSDLTGRCARLEVQRNQLREVLHRAAGDLDMIARVEKNYLAKSGAERCRAVLEQTQGGE